MYRAFYRPKQGKFSEEFVDSEDLNQLPTGAILVIKINEDGTREVISEKQNRTPKEDTFHRFAKRQLEFKHDGGDTPEMREYRRENR